MALLLTAKFKKNEKSNLILDPDSWHFKLCHPMLTREYGSYDIIRHKEKFDLPFNICPYAAQFFLMLYIGWPVLILWCCLKTLVYTPFMILFGSYPIANIESMVWFSGNILAVDVGEIPLPKIRGYKIFPIYIQKFIDKKFYGYCLSFFFNVILSSIFVSSWIFNFKLLVLQPYALPTELPRHNNIQRK